MWAALRHALMLVTILSTKWLAGAGLVPFDVAALATPAFISPAALAQKLWPGRHAVRFDDCVHAFVAVAPSSSPHAFPEPLAPASHQSPSRLAVLVHRWG